MQKLKTILGLGILIMVLSFIGIPASWKTPAIAFVGAVISLLAYLSAREWTHILPKNNPADSFVENNSSIH